MTVLPVLLSPVITHLLAFFFFKYLEGTLTLYSSLNVKLFRPLVTNSSTLLY